MGKRWTFRAPNTDDAEQVFALMVRCETAEYGEPDVDMEDLVHDWTEIELVRDAWLACSTQGGLIGYGAVMPWGSDLRYDFYVDPTCEERDLGLSLLAHCQSRGLELAETPDQVVKVYIAHTNHQDRETVIESGFKVVRYHFQMRAKLDSPPEESSWPDGIVVRTARPGQDDAALHRLVQAAFDRPGRTPQSFESWKEAMMRPDIFEPELWFLAVDGGEIVGACLSFEYPEEGWVRQLAVAQRWQRHGLGSALLRHAFGVYFARGQRRVGLTVASDNAGAHAFYQNAGMERVRQYDEYNRTVGEWKEGV